MDYKKMDLIGMDKLEIDNPGNMEINIVKAFYFYKIKTSSKIHDNSLVIFFW